MPMNSWDDYDDSTDKHFARFERFRFFNVHRAFVRFLPKQSGLCLDVGAGSGRDAAAMAARGNEVIAVEPSDALLSLAKEHHLKADITWVRDSLPKLKKIVQRGERYDFILLSAVWMHLAFSERDTSLLSLSSLLKESGYLAISLRIGPADPSRSIHEVSVADLLERSKRLGLVPVYLSRAARDSLNRLEIRWVKVVLKRAVV